VNPKLNQRIAVTRISRFSEPFNSSPKIADLPICYRDILCGTRISGVECFSQPREGFVNIFSDPISVAEEDSQSVLCWAKTVLRRSPEPLDSFLARASYKNLSTVVLASVAIAYAYGWREDELLALRVGQLDLLGKIIDLGETKNGDQRMILMTEHVFQVLVRCVAGKKSDDFVFTHDDGSPVKDFRQAWWNACIRAGLGRFECRDCGSHVSEGRRCTTCESTKKAKYIGLKFHDLRRTGIRNMSRQGIPEKVGMLISGHRTDSVYRRYNIVDMEVLKSATAKIEKHQREIVQAENNHRTAIVGTEIGADDKGKPIN